MVTALAASMDNVPSLSDVKERLRSEELWSEVVPKVQANLSFLRRERPFKTRMLDMGSSEKEI
jgi:hypothetical protein